MGIAIGASWLVDVRKSPFRHHLRLQVHGLAFASVVVCAVTRCMLDTRPFLGSLSVSNWAELVLHVFAYAICVACMRAAVGMPKAVGSSGCSFVRRERDT